MISKLVTALQHIDAEMTAEDIADTLWLALEMKKKSVEGSNGADRKLSDSGATSSEGANKLSSQGTGSKSHAPPASESSELSAETQNQSMSSGLFPGSSSGSNGKG